MKKTYGLLFLIFSVIMSLSLVRIVASNNMSTAGIELDEIESEAEDYKLKNTILKEKLLTITSYEYVASKASQMGFEVSRASVALGKSLPIAVKR